MKIKLKIVSLVLLNLYATGIHSTQNPVTYLLKKFTQAPQEIPTPTYVGLISIENDLDYARDIIRTLLQLRDDPTIKGILIHMNCFGGSFGTTQAIVNEINKIKKIKPIVVMIENCCYSCAYYLACATDFIFALPSSELGSIGVIRTIRKYKDLKFNENNVSGTMEATVITSGDYKYPGYYVPLSDEHKQYMEQNSRTIYQQFITDVAQARNLSLQDEKIWANGKEFVGTQALELGLIDALGGYTDAVEKMKELLEQRGIYGEGTLQVIPFASL